MPMLLSWAIDQINKIWAKLNEISTNMGSVVNLLKAGIPVVTGYGPPEGIVKAKIGVLYLDLVDSVLYKKVRDDGLATGWA